MSFNEIPKVEPPSFYIDVAFSRAKKQASNERSRLKKKHGVELTRSVELARILSVRQELTQGLFRILKGFPDIDNLAPFYLELIKMSMDYIQLKKSLGSIQWSIDTINRFTTIYATKMRKATAEQAILSAKKEYYGRASSAVKQLKKNLEFLEVTRRQLKNFPELKTSVSTIVLAGFPNVGKSTLLKALTGSSPKTAPYPFTTQHIMIGYIGKGKEKLQVLDTPGLLDRPFKKNNIELHAALALKHLATKIVFVIDPTDYSGYNLDEQISLLKQLKKSFRIPFLVAVNKIDNASDKQKESVKNKLDSYIEISAADNINIEEIRKFIEL